ncbi:hypothetical protein SEUCBS139899_003367 [Sporothrix eucalyptigena]
MAPALSANGHTTHIAPSPAIGGVPSLPPAGASPLSFASPTLPTVPTVPADHDRTPGYPLPQSLSPTLPTFNPPTAPPADSFFQETPPVTPQQPPLTVAATLPGPTRHCRPPRQPRATRLPTTTASSHSSLHHPPAAAPYVQPVSIDDLAMVNAQKHAKWDISALNFEDVSTVVRELRKALEFLGAS